MSEKRKLLLITGAGASIPFDMPSTNDIGNLFRQWTQHDEKWHIVGVWGRTFYDEIFELAKCKKEITGTCPCCGQVNPNFEDVIEEILLLIEVYSKQTQTLYTNWELNAEDPIPAYNHLVRPIIASKEWLNHLPTNHEELREFFEKDSDEEISQEPVLQPDKRTCMIEFLEFLIGSLVQHFRQCCQASDTSGNALSSLLTRLSEKFQLSIVNLNYDNLIYNALKNIEQELETGFDENGNFSQKRILNNDFSCLLHLHGSVYLRSSSNFGDFGTWEKNLNPPIAQNEVRLEETQDKRLVLSAPVITALRKVDQLLKLPFRTYYAKLDDLFHKADALLIIGYGFSDLHLNRAIRLFVEENKKRPIVVIDHDPENKKDFHRILEEAMLGQCVRASSREMAGGGAEGIFAHCPTITIGDALPAPKTFEKKFYVYIEGLAASCNDLEEIIKKLSS